MTEDDSGVRRFTANALEEAPTGGGGSSNPSGPYTTTIRVEDEDGDPLENVSVVVTGSGVERWRGTTDAAGELVITQGDATYTVGVTLAGYQQTGTPQTYVVSGEDQTVDVVMEQQVITPAEEPDACNFLLKVLTIDLQPKPDAVTRFELTLLPDGETGEVWSSGKDVTADASGEVKIVLPRSHTVRYAEKIGGRLGPWTATVVPDEAAAELPSAVGIQF